MQFHIRHLYSFELMNVMNVLTGDPFYVEQHPEAFELFGKSLTPDSSRRIQQAVHIRGKSGIGPLLCNALSYLPGFESRNVLNLAKGIRLLPGFDWVARELLPRLDKETFSWGAVAAISIFRLLQPVLKELHFKGFRDHWVSDRKPLIDRRRAEIMAFVNQYNLDDEFERILGKGKAPTIITLYLCTYAAPHGIGLGQARYISDVRWSKESTLAIAIHEMFHPPYARSQFARDTRELGKDPLLCRVFEAKDAKFGYLTMPSFIEENLVEAMALHICHRLGLEEKPYAYLAQHDEGSHVFSVILLDYFSRFPKRTDIPFCDYFREILARLPIGSLEVEYDRILKSTKK